MIQRLTGTLLICVMLTALGCRGTQSLKNSFGQGAPAKKLELQRQVLEDFQRNSEAIRAENAAASASIDDQADSNVRRASNETDIKKESEFVIRG